MYCTQCGAENNKGAKFCSKCGKSFNSGFTSEREPYNKISPKIVDSREITSKSTFINEPTFVKKVSYNTTSIEKNINRNGKEVKKAEGKSVHEKKRIISASTLAIITAVFLCVLLIALTIGMMLKNKKTIVLDEYISIEASGYDGFGHARARIDWDAIEIDYGDKIAYSNQAIEKFGMELGVTKPIDELEECIDVELDRDSDLSNGDIIEYSCDIDEEIDKYFNCKVKCSGGNYTVKNLEVVSEFDPFEGLNLSFYGISPNGEVDYDYAGVFLDKYDFVFDREVGLRNGDNVVVSLKNMDMSYYAQTYGSIPRETSKSYSVMGLEEYLEKYNDATDDFKNMIKAEAEDSIYAYVANNYDESVSLKDLRYYGYIFGSAKDATYYHNYIYPIYVGVVSHSEGEFPETEVYFPVEFADLIISDGRITYEENNGIKGYSQIDGGWYGTAGYVRAIACYSEIVANNMDDYSFECGDEFEKYNQYKSIMKLEELEIQDKELVLKDAKEKVVSYTLKEYNEESSVSEIQLFGEYLLVAKEQSIDLSRNNRLFIIYEGIVSNSDGGFEPTKVYYPVEYDGVVMLPDGRIDFMLTKGLMGSSSIPDSWYSTRGYIDDNSMFDELVSSNREEYRYEVSFNDKNEYDIVDEEVISKNAPSDFDDYKYVDYVIDPVDKYTSFYGVWIFGCKDKEEAQNFVVDCGYKVFDYPIEAILTTEWRNLNPEPYYAVTVGRYASEEEAKRILEFAQEYYPNAYIKYTGDCLIQNDDKPNLSNI